MTSNIHNFLNSLSIPDIFGLLKSSFSEFWENCDFHQGRFHESSSKRPIREDSIWYTGSWQNCHVWNDIVHQTNSRNFRGTVRFFREHWIKVWDLSFPKHQKVRESVENWKSYNWLKSEGPWQKKQVKKERICTLIKNTAIYRVTALNLTTVRWPIFLNAPSARQQWSQGSPNQVRWALRDEFPISTFQKHIIRIFRNTSQLQASLSGTKIWRKRISLSV